MSDRADERNNCSAPCHSDRPPVRYVGEWASGKHKLLRRFVEATAQARSGYDGTRPHAHFPPGGTGCIQLEQVTAQKVARKEIEKLIWIPNDVASERELREPNEDELAFYNTRRINGSAVLFGDEPLTRIARDLTQTIHSLVTRDGAVKGTMLAKPRTLVRRQLVEHGNPPNRTEKAVTTFLKQAELLTANCAGA